MEDVLSKLIKEGLIDLDAANQITAATSTGKSLDDAIRAVNGVAEDKVLQFLATYFDMQYVDLEKQGDKLAPPKELLAKFPARILLDRRLMPLCRRKGTGTVRTSPWSPRAFSIPQGWMSCGW